MGTPLPQYDLKAGRGDIASRAQQELVYGKGILTVRGVATGRTAEGKSSTSSAAALCLRQSSWKPGAEQFQRECEGLADHRGSEGTSGGHKETWLVHTE